VIQSIEMADGPEPRPASLGLGDAVDFSSALTDASLFVELPFWLLVPPGKVEVVWSGVSFAMEICPAWTEVFGGSFTDSRETCIHSGPANLPGHGSAAEGLRKLLRWDSIPVVDRQCKTVLRLAARAHADALRMHGDDDHSEVWTQREAYWASLCEAHLPVVNELIQRYRLLTYDPFAQEVSAWEVPVWHVKYAGGGFRVVLLPYLSLDATAAPERGAQPGDTGADGESGWTSTQALSAAITSRSAPGELDLMDARSLLERGDYTGAIRRTVTAVEAVVEWALGNELVKRHGVAEAARRLRATENDFPGRLRDWRKLTNSKIGDGLFKEFEGTRAIRHDIVNLGRRLTFEDRELVLRAVDTGRWLYDLIEGRPDRIQLRESGALKSGGGVASSFRFPASVGPEGIALGPIGVHSPPAIAAGRRT